MKEKESIRNQIWKKIADLVPSSSPYHSIPSFPGQRRTAERLRSIEFYKKAKRIFIPPDAAQFYARLSVLRDGKVLVMASPRLRDGFYEVHPDKPEHLWLRSIKSSGIRRWGKKLKTTRSDIGKIDLMVTGAVALSPDGERIGKGTGYFDWEYAILREIGCIDEDTPIAALVHDVQVCEKLPFQEKDVSVNLIITPTRTLAVEACRTRPSGIDWDQMDRRILASMRPLRELARQQRSRN